MGTSISYLTRKELDADKRFGTLISIAIPLLAILAQHFIPIRVPLFRSFDLPMLVTLYFAVGRSNPAAGSLTGAAIGLVQDAVSGLPLGIDGLANTVVGYFSASLSSRIDIESLGTRALTIFGFKLLHDTVEFLVQSHLLNEGLTYRSSWEFYSATLNALVGTVLFVMLNRMRQRR